MFNNLPLTAVTVVRRVATAPKAAYTKAVEGRERHQENVAWRRHEEMQDLMDVTGK